MTPDDITPGPDGPEMPSGPVEYVEEIVEYKDTRKTRVLLGVILAILILLLAALVYAVLTLSNGKGGAPAASSGQMQWIRSIYGWGPAQNQQLISPTSVAFGPTGVIFTNNNNNAVATFNPDGSFDHLLSSPSASATAATPHGMTASRTPTTPKTPANSVGVVAAIDVDSNNNLYVMDNSLAKLYQFTPEGRIENGWLIPNAAKISVNDSRIAVITPASLGVFTPSNGAPVFNLGSRGSGPAQFDLPLGVHIDDKNFVYVADTQNHRVRKFSPQGKLLWDAGTPPVKNAKNAAHNTAEDAASQLFELPTGVTVDGKGRVIVVDAFKFQIIVLDPATGKKIAAYGDFGQADGEFNNPSAIAYDASRDYFVVADTSNNRLQIVRIPGSAGNGAQSALRRLFDRPVWILCLPFIILAIVILIAAWMRRRRRQDALEDAQAAVPASPAPPAQ